MYICVYLYKHTYYMYLKEGENERENKCCCWTPWRHNENSKQSRFRFTLEWNILMKSWVSQKPLISFHSSATLGVSAFSLKFLSVWKRERWREGGREEGRNEREWGIEKKKKDTHQTTGGPRKIFNPNNEYCHFLPQSAFPVVVHGQAWGAKKAAWHESVCVAGAPGGEHACRGLR